MQGKRGQAFLSELLEALDALPKHELAAHSFARNGEICALGAVAVKRHIDVSAFEPGEGEDSWDDEVDRDELGAAFGIAGSMAAEIMYENDEGAYDSETPAERWIRVRKWVERNIGSTAQDVE